MQKINEVFFAEHGLTSTSANHLVNLAKELIAANEAKLNNLSFVTTKIDIVGSQNQEGKTITQGVDETFLKTVRPLLEKIAEYHAFCAWIREAVKAKEDEQNRIRNLPFPEWLHNNNISLDMPDLSSDIESDDIFETFNIRERNEYYYLQAVASTIGKYIHKKGSISAARARLQEIRIKPYSAEGTGKDTIIHSNCPSVEEEKVDEVFLDLQKWHRTVEQHLNQIKYSIQRKVAAEKIRISGENQLKEGKYVARRKELMLQFNEWKVRENEKVSILKIVIPEALQKTYDYLSSLEK